MNANFYSRCVTPEDSVNSLIKPDAANTPTNAEGLEGTSAIGVRGDACAEAGQMVEERYSGRTSPTGGAGGRPSAWWRQRP